MISILSIGYGRLHLVQSADWLCKARVTVKLVCGWVPKDPEGWLVRFCSKLIGRNLSAGMRKRAIVLANGGEVIPCAWADFLCQGLFCIDYKVFKGRFHGQVASLAWKIFGRQTKRYLKIFGRKGDVVFHVRSGAGHGGAIKLAKKLGIPVVVDHSIAHPAYMEQYLRPEFEKNGVRFDLGTSSSFWRLVAEDCEWADVVLVNSNFVKRTFMEQGFLSDKIAVAYLGVRDDFIGLRMRMGAYDSKQMIKILFTGGFGFRKGGEYILESLKILKERTDLPFEMDVVGSYNEAHDLIDRYKEYNLPITFHGPVPQDELKQYLSVADIYLFPSLAEGCASSGMEAMAAGLCVVATEESGLPIEDNETGCVVPSKDALSIVDRILKLMENRHEIDRMGRNAMKLIMDNYTWGNYAGTVANLYKRMLNRK